MLRMLGRLVWVAIGALGVKAYEEAGKEKRSSRAATTTNGHVASPTKARRKRKT